MPEPLIITFDALVKAKAPDSSGRRIIECEVSNEIPDLEGDVIEQKALLQSADGFIKYGHIDLDHISELGLRLGIKDPSSYIIGRPTEVKDLGDKRTGIVGELMKSRDGVVDPSQNKYDEVWKSLQADPPVLWRASIYGFPSMDGIIDCSEIVCTSGATRYHITAMDWKSLALTRSPMNDAIKGCVSVVTVKAQLDYLRSQFGRNALLPQSLGELKAQYNNHLMKSCPHYLPGLDSTIPFSDHFIKCCGASEAQAEIYANALMWLVTKARVLNA